MNYFKNCTSIDEAKDLFRKLCLQLHPDTNPSANAHEEFIKMREQYENFKPTAGRSRTTADKASNVYDIVSKFNNLENVIVSFIGTWIWLEDEEEGATRAQLEIIKSINIEGYRRFWNRARKIWQFKPENSKYRKFNDEHKSIDDLKNFFGSNEYKTEGVQKLKTA